MNLKYDKQIVLDLYNQGFTDKEISEKSNYPLDAVQRIRFRTLKLIANNPRETHILSDIESGIIVGTLLGDAYLRYVHKQCQYPALSFEHCIAQKDYFLWKYTKLKDLLGEYYERTSKTGYKPGSISIGCAGRNMKCLVEYREAFYQDKKNIPIEFISDKFNEYSLYCWHMDDGSKDKNTNSYIMNTQCFDKENLFDFTVFLKDKFELDFSIKKDNTLYLKHKSNEKFKEIIMSIEDRPKTMDYKI